MICRSSVVKTVDASVDVIDCGTVVVVICRCDRLWYSCSCHLSVAYRDNEIVCRRAEATLTTLMPCYSGEIG